MRNHAARPRKLVLTRTETGTRVEVVRSDPPEPAEGELLVRVHYSAVNYKDALAVTGRGRILRRSPLVGGIDAAGVVVVSRASGWKVGTPVVAVGSGLGETRDGGYADYVSAPAELWTELPQGLGLREAMILGSAGITAARARVRLEDSGLQLAGQPIVVTGASGGVGSLAVDLLDQGGCRVIAMSAREELRPYLLSLGASAVLLPPSEIEPLRGLAPAEWAGAIDNVGGHILAWVLERIRRGGKVVSIGMAASSTVTLSVFPFILREVDLLGVNSTEIPPDERARLWSSLAGPWRPRRFRDLVDREIAFEEIPAAALDVLSRRHRGRILVRMIED